MNADLVGSECLRDVEMLPKVGFEVCQIAFVVDAFFKVANETGSQADKGNPTSF